MTQNRSPGWWYPFIFVAFFVVIIGVNGTMAYFATSTFSGLSTDHAYEKGIGYNRNIAMAKAQAEMGWKVDAAVTPAAVKGQADIVLTYHDRDNRPVTGLDVNAILVRPTAKGSDQTVALSARAPGVYATTVALPLAGEWDADILAVGSGIAYQVQRRFILP
jgi:nitrogen fixation protein FixH